MTNRNKIEVFGLAASAAVLNIQVPAQLRADFAQLIFRGANLWPDASPEIKEFADLISDGRVQQDYRKVDCKPD